MDKKKKILHKQTDGATFPVSLVTSCTFAVNWATQPADIHCIKLYSLKKTFYLKSKKAYVIQLFLLFRVFSSTESASMLKWTKWQTWANQSISILRSLYHQKSQKACLQ